jgi:hypothetical protein
MSAKRFEWLSKGEGLPNAYRNVSLDLVMILRGLML